MASTPTLLHFLGTLFFARFCQGEKFLLNSMQQPSHVLEISRIGESLVQRGHQVYIINGENHPLNERLSKKPGFNVLTYRQDKTPNTFIFSDDLPEIMKNATFGSTMELIQLSLDTSTGGNEDCKHMMQDKGLLHHLKEIDFKMAVIDGFALAPCPLILPFYLNIPFVLESGGTDFLSVSKSPVIPSFQPHLFLPQSSRMDFWQRTVNLLAHFFLSMDFTIPFPGVRDTSLIQEYAPQFSTWEELAEQAELYISTRDLLLEWPTAFMPNVLTVPGLGGQPAKSLEKIPQINDIMQSDRGVILVSFGSTVPEFPEDFLKKVLEGFASAPHDVVFKYPHSIPSKVAVSSNVHIITGWMPQNDILGHPNTTLFITHCGNNGQYEALYHGVPMVGIPMFAEQHYNCLRAEAHGYGLDLKGVHKFSADDLASAITEVIQNPVYRNNTKKASLIMKRETVPPMEKVAAAIETVMEIGGGHLRPAAYDLHWAQYYMLDVIAFLNILFLLLAYITQRLARCFWWRLFGGQQTHAKSE